MCGIHSQQNVGQPSLELARISLRYQTILDDDNHIASSVNEPEHAQVGGSVNEERIKAAKRMCHERLKRFSFEKAEHDDVLRRSDIASPK